MHCFDYSFLRYGMLPSQMIGITAGIYTLRERTLTRKANHPGVLSELEHVARMQSVRSSNAIEGIVTSDRRIAQIVNQSSAPLNHDEAQIAGYRDALGLIHARYQDLDLRGADMLELHRMMMSYTADETGGHYKTDDNLIIEIDAAGNRSVRFRPTSAKDTPDAMRQLELAYAQARDDTGINQLLLIPCVILDFLCIHPFRDGNGRMSRLLSLLLLYRNGFDIGKFISFEQQINTDKPSYYENLRKSSQGWEENHNDYYPFIISFLFTLLKCYKELDNRFTIVQDGRFTKSRRIEATVLDSLVPLSKAEICMMLPDISRTTVESVLGRMLREGRIRSIGKSRSTRYLRS